MATSFDVIIDELKEKKKVSVAAWQDLKSIRGRFEGVLHSVAVENAILRGRLDESRGQIAALAKQLENKKGEKHWLLSLRRLPLWRRSW